MSVRTVRQTERIRPGQAAGEYLLREWSMCRWVWNQLVAESRSRHEADPGSTFGYGDQDKYLTHLRRTTADPHTGKLWLAEGSSVAQQQTVRDFAKSRARALMDRKNKVPVSKRAGLPKFRKRDRCLPTMNYNRCGFALKPHPETGRQALVLPGGVFIPVVWTRTLPSTPKSARVYQDAEGHWYVSFTVEVDNGAGLLPRAGHDKVLGIDWGVAETATTATLDISTGEIDQSSDFDLPHAGHGKKASQRLAHYQRKMARRKTTKSQPKTKGYKKAQKQAAKVQAKIARQRTDDARKWAKNIVSHHDRIAVENFRPKFLAKTSMARKAADAAIGRTKAELIWMAAKHGRDLRLVHPAYTTTDCATCGARTKHRLPLGERTYTCQRCGAVRPRDKNSAVVIAARAGFVPVDVEGVRLPNPAVGEEAA